MKLKTLRNIGIVAGALASAAAALAYLYRRPLPTTSGTLTAHGLRAPVEIIRDRWGVPHIYAGNLHDLLFAQGYVHAQDRLWQMDFFRRIGHGRLSEIFGSIAFDTDVLLRTIGLDRAARNDLAHLDIETLAALNAYALGVNTCMGANRSKLPLEFTLLGYQPAPWEPLDTLAWAKMQAWGLSHNWDSELLHAALIHKLGPERAARLQGEYHRENPLILHDQTYAELLEQFIAQFDAAREWLPVGGISGGSNNWVVDGEKSVTGQPLLANDPHLTLQMPSVWYENHLVSPEMEVTGVSFPGAPGVILGHNRSIAWGFTDAFADVQDLYIEKFNPENPGEYEFQGRWEKATVLAEEIRVKGEAAPRVVEVMLTRHGPVINALTQALKARGAAPIAEGLALRWTAYEPSRVTRALLLVNRARNWDEFVAALRDFDAPSQSMVYADTAGNIGYYMPGRFPIRAGGPTLTPVPGWTGEYEWTGWVPYEELPHAFNPPQHYMATANNLPVGREYPHFLTAETQNGFRARRIAERLTALDKLSADDFASLQVDLFCRPAEGFCYLLREWAPALLNHPALASVKPQAALALDLIRGWDYQLTADSVPGAIYKLTQFFAMHRVFQPWLGELTDHFIGNGFAPVVAEHLIYYIDHTPLVLQRILLNNEEEWLRDAEGKSITRQDVLAGALKDAITYLREGVGEEVLDWTWGRVHPVAFNHPLGAQKPLDKIFSRGPFPAGGDANTVWQSVYSPKLPFSTDGVSSASWRQIIDVGDWEESRAVHTTGQSGHPASRHYADMIPLWRRGEYHPMLWSRQRVEANAEARLKLIP